MPSCTWVLIPWGILFENSSDTGFMMEGNQPWSFSSCQRPSADASSSNSSTDISSCISGDPSKTLVFDTARISSTSLFSYRTGNYSNPRYCNGMVLVRRVFFHTCKSIILKLNLKIAHSPLPSQKIDIPSAVVEPISLAGVVFSSAIFTYRVVQSGTVVAVGILASYRQKYNAFGLVLSVSPGQAGLVFQVSGCIMNKCESYVCFLCVLRVEKGEANFFAMSINSVISTYVNSLGEKKRSRPFILQTRPAGVTN